MPGGAGATPSTVTSVGGGPPGRGTVVPLPPALQCQLGPKERWGILPWRHKEPRIGGKQCPRQRQHGQGNRGAGRDVGETESGTRTGTRGGAQCNTRSVRVKKGEQGQHEWQQVSHGYPGHRPEADASRTTLYGPVWSHFQHTPGRRDRGGRATQRAANQEEGG